MEKHLKQSVKTTSRQKTETLLARRENIQEILDEATSLLGIINDELYKRAEKAPNHKFTLNGKHVSIVKRLSFSKVPLEIAAKFRATKKVVDPSVLKPLYEKGVKIEGATYTEYVTVR